MKTNLQYLPLSHFSHRYISPEKLFVFLESHYGDVIEILGHSVLGKPIYKMSIGEGEVNVVAWSQMHGNESNATHAMLDLLHSLESQSELSDLLWSKVKLDFIFMLNPDGSELWTRRNALDVDMNRDFLNRASIEMQVFSKLLDSRKYDYALNLHEQRTIFTTDSVHPATLSFLAPSADYERTVTSERKKSMAVIAKVFNRMKETLPNRIGRYSDEYYPTSVGDNLMKLRIPSILFEGGHYENDYYRKYTRKYYTIALYEALCAISELRGSDEGWDEYQKIPKNKESHYDIIYRNVKLNTDYECILDIAVQYREEYKVGAEEIHFVPIVAEVGDVGTKKGWQEINCEGKKMVSDRKFPKLDSVADFTFE